MPSTEDASKSRGQARRVDDLAMAALTVGTGLGTHLAGPHGPWVASAGVMAAYAYSRTRMGREVEQLARDVAALHQQMSILNRQLEEDRREVRSRLQGLAMLSHEIRSPLASVVALGDLLETLPAGQEQQQMIRDMAAAGRAVMGVVQDTLTLAKAEAEAQAHRQSQSGPSGPSGRTGPRGPSDPTGVGGQRPVSGEDHPTAAMATMAHPFSLKALLGRVERQTRAAVAFADGVRLEMNAPPVDIVVGDEMHIEQVLGNLCRNAVRFTRSGTVQVVVEAAPAMESAGGRLTFRVRDEGPGLSLAERQQLFQPYRQIQHGIRAAQGGTGLGLFICKLLVDRMGGTIGVEGRKGPGSEFWFTVPAERVDPSPSQGLQQGVSPAPQSVLKGITVAVVDDALLNREAARRVVESRGGRCVTYASGVELLREAHEGELRADVLLMDIEMPEVDGIECSRRLRELPQGAHLPIVAVSGMDSEEIRTALHRGTLSGWVPKPFHAAVLVQEILRHLQPQRSDGLDLH